MDYRTSTFRRLLLSGISLLCLVVTAGLPAHAQGDGRTVTGTVTDESALPLVGATVMVPGTTIGTTSGLDGNFTLSVPQDCDSLRVSYIGYTSVSIPLGSQTHLNVSLYPDAHQISNVVVIGYGTQRKEDLTGSVSVISSDDFNDGLISSPEQLINGKVAGVQIVSAGGSPTGGSTIRIRGGASLNASNDPLIVVDGVPLEMGGISGNEGNFLSLINPNDIESMTVLKDASSTAIYGSRASNGVLLITTKKGSASDKLRINFVTTNSLQVKTKTPDMLSESQFREVVSTYGTADQKALLGDYHTNWNDLIYKKAFGTDNNLSVSGTITEDVPYRVSFGYYNQDGILKTDNAERYTGSISVSPSLLNNHLKLNMNVRGTLNNNRFANSSAIWGAATMNPTIPVYSGNDEYGGYYEALDGNGNPVNGAVANPVGLLRQENNTSKIKRVIGNLDVDYRVHGFEELRLHTTLGYDYAEGKGHVYSPADAWNSFWDGGYDYTYGPQRKSNQLLTTYANYNKLVNSIKSSFDVTAGYDYQYWIDKSPFFESLSASGASIATTAATDQRHTLLSFYGRFNYSYDSRYLLTATVRRDGTSRFGKDHRWGTFPSVALAWRLNEEAFLKTADNLSELKFRLSYGVTGQQDGIGNYGYLPIYTPGQNGAQYLMGNNYYYTYRPEAYVADLKWETTTSYNIGVDVGLLDSRLTASFDFYTRKTKDLLATVPAAAGTNFDKTIMTNVGNVNSDGVEMTINATPIDKQDWTWNLSFNATYQSVKIKNLSLAKGAQVLNTPAGPTIDNTYLQVLTEGRTPYTYFVYKQLYDENGRPIEGAYADLNNDGQITTDDLYYYKSPTPDWILGFNTSLRYKNWNLGMSFHANIGNYVYNGMAMNTGAWNTMSYNSEQINNLHSSWLDTRFQSRQYLSDYYVENASFLKMDNLTLGYNFNNLGNSGVRLNVSAMIQNVFTVTNYSGTDPEIPSGNDSSFYPRPRIFSLSVGFQF
ncbi:MAG: TonB-dependent receptor [Alistipes sp.]|nr:TonB-dependent receptor [Alistipes sp.]